MAETDPYPKLQRLEVPQNNAKVSKFYYHFLYKALLASIFLVIVPLLSSQAPDFVSQNINSRSWELLQLIFVGIAVSYGLFSRRSEDSEKEKEKDNSSTFDNAHSYISRLLQVSSVFDDETENPSVFDENNKIQTWNSQYYRGEPMVVVAEKDSVLQEQRKTSSLHGEKPLLLPVRSLKSRVSESDRPEPIQTGSFGRSISGSDWFSNNAENSVSPLNFREEVEQKVVKRSGSKRFSSKGKQTRNQESGGLRTPPNLGETWKGKQTENQESGGLRTPPNMEETMKGKQTGNQESEGLRTPLNMEEAMKGKQKRNQESGGLRTSPNMEETETTVVHRSPIPWRSRSGRMVFKEDINDTSPQNSGENSDLSRVKSTSSSFRSLSSFPSRNESNPPSPNKQASSPLLTSPRNLSPSPSFSGEPLAKRVEDFVRKKSFNKSSTPPPPPPPPPPYLHRSSLLSSGSREMNDEIGMTKELRRSIRSMPMEFNEIKKVELPRRVNSSSGVRATANHDEDSITKRSVRTTRRSESFNDAEHAKWAKAVEETFSDKKDFTNRMMNEKLPTASRQTFLELPEEEETEEYIEKGVVDTDDDSETESEYDYFDGNIGKEETRSSIEEDRLGKEVEVANTEECNVDAGPDVDKKADEFIAKFREQIRLQRIQSIRRSSTLNPGTPSR